MKKIHIAGGAEFLGPHVCEFPRNEGNGVLCSNNFCAGSRQLLWM